MLEQLLEKTAKYGEFSFPTPRLPLIRIWGSSEFYPDGLYISGVDDPGGCFAFTDQIKIPLKFQKDDSGNFTTATTGDFIFKRGGTSSKPIQGWIYISLGNPASASANTSPAYTIYVYDDGTKAGTKFGKYLGPEKEPEPFKDGEENYFWEMSDAEGHWLWLFRLFAPNSTSKRI